MKIRIKSLWRKKMETSIMILTPRWLLSEEGCNRGGGCFSDQAGRSRVCGHGVRYPRALIRALERIDPRFLRFNSITFSQPEPWSMRKASQKPITGIIPFSSVPMSGLPQPGGGRLHPNLLGPGASAL